jgi:hypothetical protein
MISLELVADLGMQLYPITLLFVRYDIWTLCWLHHSDKIHGRDRVSGGIQSLCFIHLDCV